MVYPNGMPEQRSYAAPVSECLPKGVALGRHRVKKHTFSRFVETNQEPAVTFASREGYGGLLQSRHVSKARDTLHKHRH